MTQIARVRLYRLHEKIFCGVMADFETVQFVIAASKKEADRLNFDCGRKDFFASVG